MSQDAPRFHPIGVSYSGEGVSKGATDITQAKISAAARLQDLCDEYEFYTPALVHIGVRLCGHDPYADFLAEQGEVHRISVRFSKPIFQGMSLGGDVEWNYVLYGIQKDKWKALSSFMGSITFLDRDANVIHRIRTQELEIADPLFFERAAVLPANCPVVKITAFVLDSSNGCFYLKTGAHPLMDLPRAVRTSQAYADTVLFADEFTKDNPNPYGRIYAAQPDNAELDELLERVRKERELNNGKKDQ